MMRRLLVFAAVLSLASSAWANVFSITNDISLMTCTDRTFPVDRGYQFRLSVQALQGATPVSLSNRYVRFRLFDSRDGKAVVDKRATIVDEGESRFEVEADFAALQPGNYQAKSESWRVTNDTLAATLSCDVLQLSYSCSTCSASSGGSGDVYLSSTTIVYNVVSAGPSAINGATTGGVTIGASGYGIGVVTTGNYVTVTNSRPQPSAGVWQVNAWNGTNELWTAIGTPESTPGSGTNVQRITTTWPITNTVVMPTSPVWLYAIGASANYSGAGGGSRGLCTYPPGTILECVIGTKGTTTTNGMPGGGAGINGATTNGAYGGAGFTEWRIAGTTGTNGLIVLGPGAGAGVSATYSILGGPGGGYFIAAQDAVNISGGSTGGVNGAGAYASDQYGTGATAGTNISSLANGLLFHGGRATTNLLTTGLTGILGGGGGGLQGGAGASKTNSFTGAQTGGAGGGGLGYVNTNYCSQGTTDRGANLVGGLPPYADRPGYTSGRGVGGGNDGCAWMEW